MYGFISQMMSETYLESGRRGIATALVPLLKLLSITIIGLIHAHPKFQMIPRAAFKLLSKLVFGIFLPCLIFTQLGNSVTFHNMILWWFIPVNVLISTLIGCILGIFVVMICQPPPQFVRFTIIMTAFGNTGNLPLAVIGSVCHGKDKLDDLFGLDCERKGVAYVSFAQWVSVILVYTLVYHMMEPPMEFYDVVDESNESDIIQVVDHQRLSMDHSKSLLVEAEWPGMDDKETVNSKTPFIARVFSSFTGNSGSTYSDLDLVDDVMRSSTGRKGSVSCMEDLRVVRKMRVLAEQTPFANILQPPTIASLLAIIVGTVPQIRGLVFGENAQLSFITDSLEIIGEAMVPSVMLILGGMLSEGPPNQSSLGLKTMIGIIIARLLILPALGIGIVISANKLNLVLLNDMMYNFVLLMQYTTPSAILLAAIARLRGYAVAEASAVLFWQHVFAIFSFSMYSVIYFKLLKYI